MAKFREFIKTQSIQKQIQITIIFISVFSTLLLGIGSFWLTKYALEKNYQEDFRYNLEISDNIMDIQMENIVNLSRGLLTNSNFMSTLEGTEGEGIYFTSSESHVFEQELGSILSQDMLMAEAAVIDNSGKLYCYRNNMGTTNTYRRSGLLEEEWVKEAQEAKGKELFYTYNVLSDETDTPTFSMVKQLIDIRSENKAGYLIINIRKKILDKSFVNLKNSYESNCFLAVGTEGDIAYFIGKEEYRDKVLKEYQKKENWNNEFIFAEAYNSQLNWTFISVMKKSELAKESKLIGFEILMIIAVVTILGTFLSKAISGRIYKPLNQLGLMIDEVGKGNRNLPQIFDDSEVGRIGNQFKKMVNNNLELRENLLITQVKEREAELLLMQSQINPHFLYNTLDSIYCMAIIDRQDNIAKMVADLSKMFRLSLNKGNKMVQVKDEVEHIKTYMEIQNVRFNNRFAFEVDIPEELEQLYVLKFILQPFVENAMYHGLEPKVGKGRIQVRAEQKGETLYFYVEDDGVGIEHLEDVYKGYGVRNVIERIQLQYGTNYGVLFESTPGQGTKVRIKLAASYCEKELKNV